jgi:hypothetical protein
MLQCPEYQITANSVVLPGIEPRLDECFGNPIVAKIFLFSKMSRPVLGPT